MSLTTVGYFDVTMSFNVSSVAHAFPYLENLINISAQMTYIMSMQRN